MEPKPRFSIIYLQEAAEFLESLDSKTRLKIEYNIMVAQYVLDKDLFKKLNDNIWEFRTKMNGMCYRLFAFWDSTTRSMVVATHGIIKKTQKTPPKEIKRAEDIMKLYYNQKGKDGKN